MNLEDWYTSRISKQYYEKGQSKMVSDFYAGFIEPRLPEKTVVKRWHELLKQYINDPCSRIFVVRKYENTKENGEWNNRRGAVVAFNNGYEIVYGSNFLAHEIYSMARKQFVPDYQDFKSAIDNRTLHITRGTKIEKKISIYGGSNKTLVGYLAHIADVNGEYDGQPIDSSLFPLGDESCWSSSPDKKYHVNHKLSSEEICLLKAHMLRFLSPMNYFETPKTNDCCHTIADFKKNIGEHPDVISYTINRFMDRYGKKEYSSFLDEVKYGHELKQNNAPDLEINLEYEYDRKKNACSKDDTIEKREAINNEKAVTTEKDQELAEFGSWLMPKLHSATNYLYTLRKILDELHLSFKDIIDCLDTYIQLFSCGGDYEEFGKLNSGAGHVVIAKWMKKYKEENIQEGRYQSVYRTESSKK